MLRMPGRMRRAGVTAVFAGAAAAGFVAAGLVAALIFSPPRAFLPAAGTGAPALRIAVAQIDGAALRVSYRWREPRPAMAFRVVPGSHRARRWSVEDDGFALRAGAGVDTIVRTDGAPFAAVTLIVRPDETRPPKDYSPVAAYGEGGALVYTGHLLPLGEDGARIEARFDFQPAPGNAATAFGAHAPSLADWRSPTGAPAFVYLGPLAPRITARSAALVDPAAPAWARAEFQAVSARALDHFTAAFGDAMAIKPNLFLTAGALDEPGRMRFSGDAAPGQFQVTLEGGAWRSPSAAARDTLRLSTIHEVFHLWQHAAAPPETAHAPGWIHEGAADIVAAEAMVALGYWDGAALEGFMARSRRACAFGIEYGALAGARRRGDFRALYGCGVVIGEAAARAGGTTASAFWRDFLIMAAARGGYSEAMFYDVVAARTDRTFADAVRRFVRTPHARPETAMQALATAAAAARAGAGARPLAQGGRR